MDQKAIEAIMAILQRGNDAVIRKTGIWLRLFLHPGNREKGEHMEFLKELFGGGALTYEQLAQAAKDKGIQAVNAAGGAYVLKADLDHAQGQVATLTAQLGEANKKLEGYDPTWKEKAETAQKELESKQFDFALERALAAAKPKNVKAVLPFLDREKLTVAGGEVIGLDKQLEALKKSADTAFLFEVEPARSTSMTHQYGGEGAPDKKDMANAALRSLFGKEG